MVRATLVTRFAHAPVAQRKEREALLPDAGSNPAGGITMELVCVLCIVYLVPCVVLCRSVRDCRLRCKSTYDSSDAPQRCDSGLHESTTAPLPFSARKFAPNACCASGCETCSCRQRFLSEDTFRVVFL